MIYDKLLFGVCCILYILIFGTILMPCLIDICTLRKPRLDSGHGKPHEVEYDEVLIDGKRIGYYPWSDMTPLEYYIDCYKRQICPPTLKKLTQQLYRDYRAPGFIFDTEEAIVEYIPKTNSFKIVMDLSQYH